MISNSLVLASYIALLSMNAIDAAMTREALNKGGFEEKMSFARREIKELGLDGAMLFKSLLPIPFVILVILCWNNAIYGYAVSLLFIVPTIVLSYVVSHNFIELWKSHQSRK